MSWSLGTWVAVAMAGGIGAVSRDRVARLLHDRADGAWLATAAVNLTGALLLGLLVGAEPGDATLAVLGTGLLGGLTTFSTWLVQTTHGPTRRRALYVLGQLGAGVALATVGVAAGAAL